ncbi:SDR family oxidoreductase [bacterium]|nr:SDR family oxidoreductase [bacterium]
MQPILITGISGFIGGRLWNKLSSYQNVYGTYHLHDVVPLHSERQFCIDLNNSDEIQTLILKLKPRCIIHLAAIAGIKDCQQHVKLAWQINSNATLKIAQTAEAVGSRLIFISTDCVFNGKSRSYREGDLVDPLSIYGQTKVSAEKNIFTNCSDAVVVRINNTYGRPVFGGSSFSEWIIERQVKGEPITVFTDQYRSFLDVITLANALVELIDHPFKGLLHIGGANRLNRLTFAEILLNHLGRDTTGIVKMKNSELDPDGMNPLDTSFDITLARKTLKTNFPRIHDAVQLAYPHNTV